MGLYYLQSRYYNPTIGRFLNADALVSTGQGVLGNNMFAYCRNNPIILEDATGTADRACIYAEGRMDEEPWRDHSPGGGGIPRRNYSSGSNYYGEVADKFYTVRLFRVVAKGVGIGAKWLYEAYMRGNNLQQNAQMQEAEMLVYRFSSPERAINTVSLVGSELIIIGAVFAVAPLVTAGSVLCAGATIVATILSEGG